MTALRARFGGRCGGGCGERIVPGDTIVYVDDEVVHVACEGDAIRPARRAPVCSNCWLEKPCSCDDEVAA